MKDFQKYQKNSQESDSQELVKELQKREKELLQKTKTITKQPKKQTPKTYQSLHQNEKFKSSKYKIKYTSQIKGTNAKNGLPVTKRLSVMAWNVWNEGHNVPNSNIQQRYNEIVKIITAKNPDLICLQQTQKFRQRHLQQFLKSMKGSQYYSPDLSLLSFNSSIILCKYPAKFYEVKFSKGFKTKPMAVCQFKINCKDGKSRTVVAHSVHLKARSTNQQTQSTRLLQLKFISKINRCFDISIAAGDYNFDDSHPEDKYVKYDFLDLQNHHKNPRDVHTLPQYQPLSERTELRFRNFSKDFFHQHEESSDSEDDGQDMFESQFQSQDQFDGYSDSFYEDSSLEDGLSDGEISSYGSQSYYQENDYYDGSEDNSFDSEDEDFDDDSDDSGSDEYGRGRSRHRQVPRDYRRRMIQRPAKQRQHQHRQFRFIPANRGRPFNGNRPHPEKPRRDQGHRNRLPPAHQIPNDSPGNTWTYLYYPDKSKYRFDRILLGCTELEKHIFRQKIKVVEFERVGNYSIGRHSTKKFMAYLFDKIVRSPSDHLGVYSVFFLNF